MRRSLPAFLFAAALSTFLLSVVYADDRKPLQIRIDDTDAKDRQKISNGTPDEIQMPPEAMEKPPPGAKKGKPPSDEVDAAFTPAQAPKGKGLPAKTDEAKRSGEIGVEGKKPATQTPQSGTIKKEEPAVNKAQSEAQKDDASQNPKTVMLSIPVEGLQDIPKHWEKRRAALLARDFGAAGEELMKIALIRKGVGASNLFGVASALVQESKTAFAGQDYPRSLSLAESAVELAPNLPSAYFQQAYATLRGNRTNAVLAAKSLQEGVREAVSDPPNVLTLVANFSFVFGIAVILALLFFTVSILAKYGRLIVHDLSHLFPDDAPRLIAGMTVTLILFAPLVLGAGPISCVIFWSLVAWVYSSWRERIVLAACVTVLSLAPLAYPTSAVLLDQGENDSTLIYRAFRDGEATSDIARVIDDVRNGSYDPYKLWAAGLWLKRTGKYPEAERVLRQTIDLLPREANLQVNLGNLYLVQDRFYEAQNSYARALELDPLNALGHYNLSQLFFRNGSIEKAQREHQEAVRLDPSFLERTVDDASSINTFVLDAQPDNATLMRLLLAPGSPRRVLITGMLENYSTGTFSRGDMPYILGLSLALMILLTILRRRLSPSDVCVKCGRSACTRCNPEMTAHTHCGQCFHLYVLRDVPDSRMRSRKEIEAWQRKRRTRIVSWFMAVLIPGSGQVLTGSPILGFLVMFITGLAVVTAVTAGGPVPGRFADLNAFFGWMRIALIVFAALVYLQSLRSALRKV